MINRIFIVCLFIMLSSCSASHRYQKYEKIFTNRVAKYSKQPDIIFINPLSKDYYKTDTISISGSAYRKDLIPIVITGDQTFNFARLCKIDDKSVLPLDSSACSSRQFMTIYVNKHNTGDYVLQSWGCHFGYSVFLKLR